MPPSADAEYEFRRYNEADDLAGHYMVFIAGDREPFGDLTNPCAARRTLHVVNFELDANQRRRVFRAFDKWRYGS